MVIYITKGSDASRLLREGYFHLNGELAYTNVFEVRRGPTVSDVILLDYKNAVKTLDFRSLWEETLDRSRLGLGMRRSYKESRMLHRK